MRSIPDIFAAMSDRYVAGVVSAPRSYYFAVGVHEYTVVVAPQRCDVVPGRPRSSADVTLRATPDVFRRMFLRGRPPGTLDIARRHMKTNDPRALAQLLNLFRFDGM